MQFARYIDNFRLKIQVVGYIKLIENALQLINASTNLFAGGFGVDFSYDVDTVNVGIMTVAKGILAHGVTSFCPTLVSSHPHVYTKVCSKEICIHTPKVR